MLQKIFSALTGRTTAFLGAFFLTGNALHFLHRLDATYISFMGVLMGFVLGHSVKEDLVKKDDDSCPPKDPGQP